MGHSLTPTFHHRSNTHHNLSPSSHDSFLMFPLLPPPPPQQHNMTTSPASPTHNKTILKMRPQTDSKVYLKRKVSEPTNPILPLLSTNILVLHLKCTSLHSQGKFSQASFGYSSPPSHLSPLGDSSNRYIIPPAPNSCRKTPNRLTWTKDTPMKSCPRNIRRLESNEKNNLYHQRPDLDPAGGSFSMQAWMDGQDQEPEYSDSDDSSQNSLDSPASSTNSDDHYQDSRCDDENNNNTSVTKSFLNRLTEMVTK